MTEPGKLISVMIRALRSRGVPVGLQEAVALASALAQGLHESSLEGFHDVARALLVHDEARLDDFEQVFAHVFAGVPYATQAMFEELRDSFQDEVRDWLENPRDRPQLTEEEKADLKELSLEELLRMFEERLREQTEHDGGNYWIGTGGRSPFGTGGVHPSGLSLRSGPPGSPGGGRSLARVADPRRYRAYRHDLVLDVRQLEVALRKLRSFDRSSARPELDLEGTIDATARNFGELELAFRKPRRPNTRVILLMDVGGSMEPYAALVSQLFTAAKRATHWKELRTYYFHNCVYSRLYRTDGVREPYPVQDLLRECEGAKYKLILVGDASMAPYELHSTGISFYDDAADRSGLDWLLALREHFASAIWLNPEILPNWRGETAEAISRVFPMFPLTLQGLEEGLQRLGRTRD